MFYVYILKSQKKPLLYIGYTTNVKRRVQEHNEGVSLTTSKHRPWQLIYLEGYADENDAKDREKKLKQFGKVYSQLKRRILRSLGTQKVRG
jgi:putative endonuclease